MSRRILLGKFLDGGYGLRISAPGYDVNSNPVNNDNLYFNSDWPELFPIYARGAFTAPTAATTYTVNYANLGYVPYIVGAFTTDGLNFQDLGSCSQEYSRQVFAYGTGLYARMTSFADHLDFVSNIAGLTVYYAVLTTQAF